MAFDFSTLITDRSPEDLQALRDLLATPMADWTAEQLAEFNQAVSKGAYNYTDLNRVIAAMDDLNERLTGLGYQTEYQRIQVPHQIGDSRLPQGYTELQYIESSGTQYVDTGIKPNQDTQVAARLMLLSSTTAYLFGARGNNDENFNNRYGILYTGDQLFRSDYNTGNGPTFPPDLTPNVAYPITKNKNMCAMGDYSVTSPQGVFQSPYDMLIGCVNEGGSPAYFSSLRIYSFSIFADGEICREYVPAINPNGEIGLYDLVNDQFYGNAGSGSFTAGPEVPPPDPEPTLAPYTWYEADVPTESLLDGYLANVAALRAVLALPETTPPVPADMAGLTQAEANDIESILDIINTYLVALQSILRRCGAVVCGGPELYFVN